MRRNSGSHMAKHIKLDPAELTQEEQAAGYCCGTGKHEQHYHALLKLVDREYASFNDQRIHCDEAERMFKNCHPKLYRFRRADDIYCAYHNDGLSNYTDADKRVEVYKIFKISAWNSCNFDSDTEDEGEWMFASSQEIDARLEFLFDAIIEAAVAEQARELAALEKESGEEESSEEEGGEA